MRYTKKREGGIYSMKGITGICAALISVGMLLPSELLPDSAVSSSFQHTDKLLHGGAFGGLTVLALMGWDEPNTGSVRIAGIACAVFALSVALECIQLVGVRGRNFEVLDILANFTGIFLVCLTYLLIVKKR